MTILPLAAYLVGYAILHSLAATWAVKRRARALFGPQLRGYRLAYVIFSVLLLAPVLFLPVPHGILYTVPFPLGLLFRGLQFAALIGLVQSLREVELGSFLGLSRSGPLPTADQPLDECNDLVVSGLYRRCRHPLYFFGTVALAATPTMSIAFAVFTLWAGLYFAIGSVFEERRLVDRFGEAYRTYRARTPRFLPLGPRT